MNPAAADTTKPGNSDPADAPGTPALQHAAPHVPDHELLKNIGGGSYGEVWVARNKLGTLRAVKVVYRSTFEDSRPFEREFKGIQKFEPISRSHEGLVDILQVGGGEEYFYYVMELADDALVVPPLGGAVSTGASTANGDRLKAGIQTYVPRTLRHDLKQRGRLPVDECVKIGHSLAGALAHLHQHGLVHRDVKPSNIIFVGGVPKLADIGLVADVSEARSFVGTEGFIPPEGPGTPQADVYSLGKVLYEISTGKDRRDFPALPDDLAEEDAMLELNAVILKACKTEPHERYQSAKAMLHDLESLQLGKSIRRKRLTEQRLAMGRKIALIAGALVLLISAPALLKSFRGPKIANPEAVRLYELGRFYYNRLTDEDLKQCAEFMNRAIEIDSKFVPAYVTLFEVAIWAAGDMPWEKRVKTQKEVAMKLAAIAPDLGETHACLSWVKWNEDDAETAEQEIKLAIQLNPNYSTAFAYYGCYLVWLGRVAEAPQYFKRAREIDPASPVHATVSGFPLYALHQFDGAIAQFRKALELNPNFGFAHMWIGRASEAKGDYLTAIEEYEQIDLKSAKDTEGVRREYQALRQVLKESGEQGYWRKVIELQLDRKEKNLLFNGRYESLAMIYARLGEKEKALKQLEKEVETGDYDIWLKTDAAYDCLRDDPRFKALLKKAGLEK
jgi:tetratricopeptide (TPR) repeat protein